MLEPAIPSDVFERSPRRPTVRRAATPRGTSVEGLLTPGTILDKYRIDALLGTGGFGAVYRATHLILRTTVAIKHLRPDVLARRPDIAPRLLDEARWAARIVHPRVVRVFDVTQGPALTYVVMEYVDGGTLARAIATRVRLPPNEVVSVGVDVAEGLEAALGQGLVHRDVKPANILLGSDGRARIVDLGLARALSSDIDTRDASIVGTRGYAAPEQLEAPARVDFRADVYSLGVTLREALLGRRGQGSEGASEGPLARVLGAMTARRPSDRPESYSDVRRSLRGALRTR